MANRTNSSEYFWSYEYYWDYIDPIPVDGSKLKVNKYSIVIAFWVGLAAFVTFLFLILLYMSRSGSTPVKATLRLLPLMKVLNRIGCLRSPARKSHSQRQVIVGNQIEESSSTGEQPRCDALSSPYSDVVASQTPTSLSDETGIHGRI
ncbi:melanocortin-2 receptor accessory protein [Falco naumanni]|uniref:melanocortin-2 receptor accessory protein n=1 Tax=Falco naumanni TaxID=148594 RepID=UPI001ADEB1F8|nr:melanocortin-2 receptor accessory protein [Falco naumanni]